MRVFQQNWAELWVGIIKYVCLYNKASNIKLQLQCASLLGFIF